MKLPAAGKSPLDPSQWADGLSNAQRSLVEATVGDRAILRLTKTRTRVDVGAWFRKARLIACLLESELVLLAAGARPYVESIEFDNLRDSAYNHVTGEIMLAPAEGLRPITLNVTPLEGLHILAHIHSGENNNA